MFVCLFACLFPNQSINHFGVSVGVGLGGVGVAGVVADAVAAVSVAVVGAVADPFVDVFCLVWFVVGCRSGRCGVFVVVFLLWFVFCSLFVAVTCVCRCLLVIASLCC